MASKPMRDRQRRNDKSGRKGKVKAGDRVLSAISSIGRMSLGAVPRAIKMPRPQNGESFSHALIDPFSVEARGSRVPDLYAFPTNTFRVQTSILLGSTQTEFGATFLPNPFVSVIDSGAISVANPSITSPGGMRRFGTNTGFLSMTTPTLFTPLATEYRVVGGGIKIRNLLPELTATGRIYIAVMPLANGGVPSWNVLNGAPLTTEANYNNVMARMGLPTIASQRAASLQLLPLSKDFTVGQIVGDEEIEVPFTIYHPDFFRFKPTAADNRAYDGTIGEADDVTFNIATGVVQGSSGNKEATQCDGGSAIIVWFEGIPATTAAPFEVDFCLHLECVPLVATGTTGSTTGITPESDNPPRSVGGCTALVEHEITQARRDPDSIIRLHRNDKGAGGARIAEID